jgi:sugar O-acyltransferase (sialic acid O-acetyltransferase NeuD family)
MKKKIVIIGSHGHAKVIIDIVEKQNLFSIVGLVDSNRAVGENTLGYPIIGNEDDLPSLMRANMIEGCIIAVGDNWKRKLVLDKLNSKKIAVEFVTAIHPSAQIGKNVTIGIGTMIMAGAIINSDATVGKFTIINTKASVGHDCFLGDFTSLAPNVTLGGNVRIGNFSAISISATLIHSIAVGEHSVIGAGSVVLDNIDNLKLSFGVPAKIVRERIIGEKYL